MKVKRWVFVAFLVTIKLVTVFNAYEKPKEEPKLAHVTEQAAP
jgi:hypothetical protein